MKLANKLTLSRLGMAFVMTLFLSFPIPFGKTLGLLTFLLAAGTDYLDGRLARGSSGISAFGQLLDPLADKILVCAAFICFVAMDQIVPAWIVAVIITREFMVTGLRLLAVNQGRVIPAGRWGKHKTIWQIVVIAVIILGAALPGEILPLFLRGDQLQMFLTRYYNHFFGWVTFAISALVAIFTVFSGSVYFWQCRELVMKDA